MELRGLLERWRTGPLGPTDHRRPPPRAAPRPLTLRPWDPAEGDPGAPTRVSGVDVHDQVRTRRDGVPGALLVLADGRYAFTGPVTGVGSRVAVQDAARRQLRLAATDAERAWWRQVIGALAAPEE